MSSHASFKIMNRTVNRLLHGPLDSPLHRLVSGKIALLSYHDRPGVVR